MESEIMSGRPAFRVALLFVAGILLAGILPLSVYFFLVPGLIVLLASVILHLRNHLSASSIFLHAAVILTAATLSGIDADQSKLRRLMPLADQEPVTVEGVIDAEPVSKPSSIQLVLRTGSIIRPTGPDHTARRVLTLVRAKKPKDGADSLRVGSLLRLNGVIEEPPRPRNPGEFDYGRYLSLHEIDGVVRVSRQSDLALLGIDEAFSTGRIFHSARQALLDRIERYHTGERGAFLKGILLADRGEIPLDLKQSFVDTGTIHVLAVSGLHVGIIAAIVHVIFGLLRIPRKIVVFATMVTLLFYAGLTGAPPSVVRATIMAWVILAGTLLERKGDIYNSIGFAALLILVYDPKQLFNVGFQLSFSAVLSIVALYPILERWIQRIPERFEELKMIDPALKLFAVSLAAQLGTLPFTAYYFERVSIVALAANLVVVPMVLANVTLGFITLLSSTLSDWLASCYSVVNDVLIDFLYGIVKAAANVPFAFFETAGLGMAFPILYYCGLGTVFVPRSLRVRGVLVVLFLSVGNILLFTSLFSESRNVLSATVLDVGQGDAVLINLPNGKNILVDGGPQTFTADAGERVVGPYLRRRGITSLDAVIISHPHSDHLGGIQYLLEHFQVGTLVEADTAVASRMHSELRSTALRKGIPVSMAGAGTILDFDPACRLYVLHPRMSSDRENNLNNHSLVVRIVYGKTSLLLTGDAELEAEGNLVARYKPFLDSDILKAGHHGSITSSGVSLIEAVSPRWVLVSVGKNNKFRHPSPVVMERFREKGIKVLRTDQEGALIVESDGEGFQRIDWRN